MRINREIRVPKVRLIGKDGSQVGVVSISEALEKANLEGLDLVEISPQAEPPVCKIIDYGKYRYQLTKKERESKKALTSSLSYPRSAFSNCFCRISRGVIFMMAIS